jgi:hypothetical protein
MAKNHIVQLDFSNEAYKSLQRIEEKIGVTSDAKAIGNAIRLYQWFLDRKEAGEEIQIVGPDGNVRVVELVF